MGYCRGLGRQKKMWALSRECDGGNKKEWSRLKRGFRTKKGGKGGWVSSSLVWKEPPSFINQGRGRGRGIRKRSKTLNNEVDRLDEESWDRREDGDRDSTGEDSRDTQHLLLLHGKKEGKKENSPLLILQSEKRGKLENEISRAIPRRGSVPLELKQESSW